MAVSLTLSAYIRQTAYSCLPAMELVGNEMMVHKCSKPIYINLTFSSSLLIALLCNVGTLNSGLYVLPSNAVQCVPGWPSVSVCVRLGHLKAAVLCTRGTDS